MLPNFGYGRAPCEADPSDANGRRVDPSHANGMLHLQNAHRTKIFGTIRTTRKDLIRTSVHQQKWNMEDADSNSVAKCFDQRSLVLGIVARKDLLCLFLGMEIYSEKSLAP